MEQNASFSQRGGWWVVAQIPLLILAGVLPVELGSLGESLMRPFTLLGGVFILAGTYAVLAGAVTLRRTLSPYPYPLPDAELITHGVFGYVRHPIYLGLLLGSCGWALLWSSYIGAISTFVLAVFFYAKAKREERWLYARFPAYVDYASKVPMFVPEIF